MVINIVGGDGCGKTTQVRMLQPWIEGKFRCPVRIVSKGTILNLERFPESRCFGCPYEEIAEEIVPQMIGESRSLFLFFMLAVSICRYPPGDDEVVILDGYWHKNFATEAALGINPDWLRSVASFFPVPDVTILLDIDPESVTLRGLEYKPYECGFAADCNDRAFVENQKKVLSFLKDLANSEGWPVVDASRSKEVIFEDIKLIVHDRLSKFVG